MLVYIGIAVVALILLTIIGGWAWLNYWITPQQQFVAANVMVSPEWAEITPPYPLTVTRRSQRLYLLIEGHKENLRHPELDLADGTIVSPEIQIVDDRGTVYDLQSGVFVGDAVGFSRKNRIPGYPHYPADRTYTKVKIRSDIPFKCTEIYWQNKYEI